MDRAYSNDARTPAVPRPERDPVAALREQPLSRDPEVLREKGYVYHLSPAEQAALADIGRFRAISVPDLIAYRYRNEQGHATADLQHLANQGLLERHTLRTSPRTPPLELVVLTRRGQHLLQHHRADGARQRFYRGLVKPAEARHDAAIYGMFQAERQKIVAAGGEIRRVVLDFELKRNVYRPLAKARHLPPLEYAVRQAEIARQNGLKVVGGKILLPDLRIEYVTRSGSSASVDLELATEHYRGAMMRAKAAAGFKMYAPQDSMSGLTSAFDPELVAQVISL